jgi:hypothetical protein
MVTDNCGTLVDCGACAWGPTCGACFTCDPATGTCIVDDTQAGDDCGQPGQVCQATGTCACTSGGSTCGVCRECQPNGACSGICSGSGCCNGVTCELGTDDDACGVGGAACVACADLGTGQTCGGGNPGTPGICGCTPTTCAEQNQTCGTLFDSCGTTLTCTGCTGRCSGTTCVASFGCTATYWKSHTASWAGTGYDPGQIVGSVFSGASAFPSLASETLLQALQGGGGVDTLGGAKILLRAATAALLNAATPAVAYPRTVDQVLADVNGALASNIRNTMLALATELDNDNNLGCPLN